MSIKFKVFKWAQSQMGLFLLSGGTARGSGEVNASIVHMLNLPCLTSYKNTCTYNFSSSLAFGGPYHGSQETEVMVKNVKANIPVSLLWFLLPFLAFLCFPASAQFIDSSL